MHISWDIPYIPILHMKNNTRKDRPQDKTSWCLDMGLFSILVVLCEGNLVANPIAGATVYPKKYAHAFVVLCFVVVMQSLIMNSHEAFIHIHQGCFAGIGAIVRLLQCQWSKPDGYGKTSQCITTTKHSKAKTVCIFLGIYCLYNSNFDLCVNSLYKLT